MDRARASAIGVIATAVLASGLLWLVPGVTRQVEGRGEEATRRDMTSAEADAQVKAALDALEAGINQGNPDLALVGFATEDAEWLAGQRALVTGTIERLQGHPAKLEYSHPSYWGHMAGGKEVVARRVYSGPTLVVDAVSGQIVGQVERYAIAPEGRFLLHPFPQDDKLRLNYEASLGGSYAKLGHAAKAFEVWARILERYPEADPSDRATVYEYTARTHAEAGDAPLAYAAYEDALAALQSDTSSLNYSSMEFGGAWVRVLRIDQLRLRLAETAVAMGEKAQARRWYQTLAKSDTEELANLAAERLKTL